MAKKIAMDVFLPPGTTKEQYEEVQAILQPALDAAQAVLDRAPPSVSGHDMDRVPGEVQTIVASP